MGVVFGISTRAVGDGGDAHWPACATCGERRNVRKPCSTTCGHTQHQPRSCPRYTQPIPKTDPVTGARAAFVPLFDNRCARLWLQRRHIIEVFVAARPQLGADASPLRQLTPQQRKEVVLDADYRVGPGADLCCPTGLPLGTIPVSKLESGRAQPASVLAEAERRADRMLAARSLLELAVDSQARSGAGGHCNGAASSQPGPELPAAS